MIPIWSVLCLRKLRYPSSCKRIRDTLQPPVAQPRKGRPVAACRRPRWPGRPDGQSNRYSSAFRDARQWQSLRLGTYLRPRKPCSYPANLCRHKTKEWHFEVHCRASRINHPRLNAKLNVLSWQSLHVKLTDLTCILFR